MSNLFKLILFICFVCFILLAGPWCFIWALNAMLIGTGLIPSIAGLSAANGPILFTFWNWLAAVILGGLAILPSVRRS